MFVGAGGLGDTGYGYVVDGNDEAAETVFVEISVINCTNEYHQVYDKYNTKLFNCFRCVYGQYTMKRNLCKKEEFGTLAVGGNNVTVLQHHYAEETTKGYLVTGSCPTGYCCLLSSGCSFITHKKYLCRKNRDRNTPLCGKCKNGYSETTSHVGFCKVCDSYDGLSIVIMPIFLGIGMIALFVKQGMEPPAIPHPFMV